MTASLEFANALAALRDETKEHSRDLASAPRNSLTRSRTAAFAIAVVVVGVLALCGHSFLTGGVSGSNAWAAADVAFALRTPKALITSPAWRAQRVDQYGKGNLSGELVFKPKQSKVEVGIFWVPALENASYVRDRAHGATAIRGVTVEGKRARVFETHATSDRAPNWTGYSALWISGDFGMRFETGFPGLPNAWQRKRFLTLLKSVRTVSTDTWLSAMPNNALLPGALPAATREILRDVPTPVGFSSDPSLKNLSVITEPMLAARLIIAVECAWVDIWVDARRRGDKVRMAHVVKNLSDYKTWRYNKGRKMPGSAKRSRIGSGVIESLSTGGAIPTAPGKTRDINSRLAGNATVGNRLYESWLGCPSPR